ncbi:hypothetical protein [Dactylosporangium sp. NPDC005555]|uniref:hypothetical protein n=1 Tax=Dactylosporangium sp. NPDC005555 TaxID=3154889 RepID=UPI0033AA1231
MRTTTMFTALAAAAVLLTACTTQSPERQAGDALPAGSAAAPTSAAAPPPATPSSPASSSPAASSSSSTSGTPALVLGPQGYGTLRLGMTKEQASATGLITPFDNSGCPQAFIKGLPAGKGWVVVSPNLGLVAIEGWEQLATPEGMRIGTSADEMRSKYPTWKVADSNGSWARGYVKVPGNDKAEYRIITMNNKVTEVTLQAANQNCYE